MTDLFMYYSRIENYFVNLKLKYDMLIMFEKLRLKFSVKKNYIDIASCPDFGHGHISTNDTMYLISFIVLPIEFTNC